MLLVLPAPGVVTEIDCVPSGAAPSILSDAVIVVKLLLTSVPGTRVTPAGRFRVPSVRPVPVRTTGTVAPVPPVLGARLASTGIGPVIVNTTALVVPFTSVAVTLTGPTVALAAMVKVAVTEPAVATTFVTAIFGAVTVVTPARLVPARVTVKGVEPALAVLGVMLVSAGRIVNDTVLLVPPGVVIEMFFGPAATVEAMTSEALTFVGLTTTRFETVIPVSPVVMAVA